MLNALLDQTLTFPVNTPGILLFDTGNPHNAKDLFFASLESHQCAQHAKRIDAVGLGASSPAIDLQTRRVDDIIDNASFAQNTVQPKTVIAGLIT